MSWRRLGYATCLLMAACSSIDVDRDNRPCDAQGRCLEGYTCDPVAGICVRAVGDCARDVDGDGIRDCFDPCLDADGDGFGTDGLAGVCLGTDCDDTAATCTIECTADADADAVVDCRDPCIDFDGDGYGLGGSEPDGCWGLDCDDDDIHCNTDCTTDTDHDGVADCRDPCLDADGDGYGADGPFANCLGPDCDDQHASCTTDCSGGCSCVASDVIRLRRLSGGCGNAAPGGSSAVVAWLELTSTCGNALNGVTFSSHPASQVNDTDLARARLYVDVDASGDVTSGDLPLGGQALLIDGDLSFSSIDRVFGASERLLLLLAIEPAEGAGFGHFVPQLADTSALIFADSGATVQFVGGAPFVAGLLTVAAPICTAPPGTFAVDSAKTVVGPNNPTWSSGAGNEATWVIDATASGVGLSDCDTETAGTGLSAWDRGTRTRFVHLSTGVPTGLPLAELGCRLVASVQASALNAATGLCDGRLLSDYEEAWLFAYEGPFAVAAASLTKVPVVASAGPPTTNTGCGTESAELDVTTLYVGASTDALDLRLILEGGGGIDNNDNLRLGQISEVYLQIRL